MREAAKQSADPVSTENLMPSGLARSTQAARTTERQYATGPKLRKRSSVESPTWRYAFEASGTDENVIHKSDCSPDT
jgi:hypothetical protein